MFDIVALVIGYLILGLSGLFGVLWLILNLFWKILEYLKYSHKFYQALYHLHKERKQKNKDYESF